MLCSAKAKYTAAEERTMENGKIAGTGAPVLTSKRQILDALHRHADTIAGFGVERLGLFGSFVRNEQNADSDVDFLVVVKSGRKTFDNFYQLAVFLEDLVGRPVEILTLESLSPYIGPHILKEVEYVDLAA